MNFAPSPAQKELQEKTREAVARIIVPVAAAVPPGRKLSADQVRQLYKGLAPLGYLGSTIPRDAGGAGLSYADYGLMLEVIGGAGAVERNRATPDDPLPRQRGAKAALAAQAAVRRLGLHR
ncbi:MAG: acyl-CoA dehydrogenase family protein, partial [Alphaproteobacteria bacterium]|nr:acyl-CoA dehydrogenase family protein [Alphaproteobacteria bacterium]